MCNPKLIAPSKGTKAWFECPFCFELFEAYKSKVKGFGGTYASCGCRRAADTNQLNTYQRNAVAWLKRQVSEAYDDLPPILKKLNVRRTIAYEWNTDANYQAPDNFLEFIGDRPNGAWLGWKDPLGPISPDNFTWLDKNVDKSGTNRITDTD